MGTIIHFLSDFICSGLFVKLGENQVAAMREALGLSAADANGGLNKLRPL